MSPNKQLLSFKKALGWTFVLLMVFFLLLRLMVFEPQREDRVEQVLIAANEATLRQLSDAMITPILQRKFAALYTLLDSQLEKSSWLRMRIVDTTGKQIYPLDEWDGVVVASEVLITQSIGFEGERIGAVDLVLDFSTELADQRESAYLQEGLQAVIIALALFALFLAHRRHIERPLNELGKAMGEMTLSNFDYPLPDAKFQEIDDLVKIFEHSRYDVESYQRNLLELKEEADKANEAKSLFLSNMSHELRTPLNAIIGFTDLLNVDRERRLGDTEREYIGQIKNAGRILLELISQLLDLAQIESGKVELDIQKTPLNELIAECVDLIVPVARQKNVAMAVFDGDCLDVAVLADPARLKQVLLNLLSNAVKYSSEDRGGQVTVQCSRVGKERVRVTIEDNGLGISAADLERLFLRFERLKAVNSNIEGTGIGLYLCKEFIDAMGGAIGVTSELDSGSSFWFELPYEAKTIQPEKSGPEDSPELQASKGLGAGKKLLYIDDSLVNLALVEALIQSHTSMQIITADVPQEGLQAAYDEKPELILLDIRMPGMDGFEVLTRLKADSRTQNIPVIAYTANISIADRGDIDLAGFDDCLTKPVNLQLLIEMLEKHIAD